ncbi:MAG: hypothetical protein ABIG63_08290, partial [Chloroflexota bacterium]
ALQLSFRINQQKLAATQELDGRYPLATNADHLEANEALTVFKGQDGVEKRFRTIKGPLLVRPIFVRSDQRIEADTHRVQVLAEGLRPARVNPLIRYNPLPSCWVLPL